jgi:hypothetical protein
VMVCCTSTYISFPRSEEIEARTRVAVRAKKATCRDGAPDAQTKKKAEPAWQQLGDLETSGASVGGPRAGVAEEARIRGFAAPAFAGCARMERIAYYIALRYITQRCTALRTVSGQHDLDDAAGFRIIL